MNTLSTAAASGSGTIPLSFFIPMALLLIGAGVFVFIKHPDAMKRGAKNIGAVVGSLPHHAGP